MMAVLDDIVDVMRNSRPKIVVIVVVLIGEMMLYTRAPRPSLIAGRDLLIALPVLILCGSAAVVVFFCVFVIMVVSTMMH